MCTSPSARPAGARTSAAPRSRPFSSAGLAFGGGIKPEVAAPGVELVTADPGRNADRTARYATISGTSAATALAGGAAAALAQARPGLDATALKGALVGTSVPAGTGPAPPRAQARSMRECRPRPSRSCPSRRRSASVQPARRAGRRCGGSRCKTCPPGASASTSQPRKPRGIGGLSVAADPELLRLTPGSAAQVKLTARLTFLPRRVGAIQGQVRLEVGGGGRVAVPWAVALPVRGSALIGGLNLSARSFRASDRAPAVLTVQAGQVRDLAGRRQLRPLSRLDVELWRGSERIGLVARLRDVLPGRYVFRLRAAAPAAAPSQRAVPAPRRRRAARRPGRGGGGHLQDSLRVKVRSAAARALPRKSRRCPLRKPPHIFARTR